MSFLIIALLVVVCAAAPVLSPKPLTILGLGVTDYGAANLVCFLTLATNVLIFFLTNYVANAASTPLPHGASTGKSILAVLKSLAYPVTGFTFAVEAFMR